MIHCLVVGHAVSMHCHPSLAGRKMLLCQPLDADKAPSGAPLVAVDCFGAGLHSEVFVSTDGIGARHLVHDNMSPVRHFIQGVID